MLQIKSRFVLAKNILGVRCTLTLSRITTYCDIIKFYDVLLLSRWITMRKNSGYCHGIRGHENMIDITNTTWDNFRNSQRWESRFFRSSSLVGSLFGKGYSEIEYISLAPIQPIQSSLVVNLDFEMASAIARTHSLVFTKVFAYRLHILPYRSC